MDQVRHVVRQTAGECGLHQLTLHRAGGRVCVSFHCRMPQETPVSRAHDLTMAMENALRNRLPEITRVTIHMEPETPPPAMEP